MSWSGISKIVEKKIMDEVKKQLNLDVHKDGEAGLNSLNARGCRFCGAIMPIREIFCPACGKSQK
ncbi:MAG: hypothetical protein NTX81_09300 [Candidatus Bathyarchaeota archaeon]|jgi:rRNA maturation endonuclease Nob1|nr:hypothetical protein [Candidatus Bathyarchaeota archaeon]